jgi:hypothetical protein
VNVWSKKSARLEESAGESEKQDVVESGTWRPEAVRSLEANWLRKWLPFKNCGAVRR